MNQFGFNSFHIKKMALLLGNPPNGFAILCGRKEEEEEQNNSLSK